MKPRDVALLCLPAVLLLAAIALPGTKKKVQGDPSQFLGSAEDNSKQLIESNRPSVEYLKSL